MGWISEDLRLKVIDWSFSSLPKITPLSILCTFPEIQKEKNMYILFISQTTLGAIPPYGWPLVNQPQNVYKGTHIPISESVPPCVSHSVNHSATHPGTCTRYMESFFTPLQPLTKLISKSYWFYLLNIFNSVHSHHPHYHQPPSQSRDGLSLTYISCFQSILYM